MLISIIVPVYNAEKYLAECLDSIRAQTYKNIEVVMVNDGSTDSSGEICDQYAARYDNFRVIHKENEGLGEARNTGLQSISGDFVTFLDSDDHVDSDYIEQLCDCIIKHKVDVCKSGFYRVTDKKEVIKEIRYSDEVFSGSGAKLELLPRLIGSRPDKKDSVEMAVCGTLYNVRHIVVNNLRFPSERQLISEDLVFNIDYMQHADGACTTSYIGYNYRVNEKSLSTKYRKDRFEAVRHFHLEMDKKLRGLGYEEETLVRLQRLFFVYIRMCIRQEGKNVSGLSRKVRKANIAGICDDELVQTTIRQYPKDSLGRAQKLFLLLVEKRCAGLLMLFSDLKML